MTFGENLNEDQKKFVTTLFEVIFIRNLSEDQKKRSLPQFEVIFIGNLSEDRKSPLFFFFINSVRKKAFYPK